MEEHQNPTEIDRIPDGEANDGSRTPENVDFDTSRPHTGDGASPGKIFIGGLARETTPAQFIKHFGKYGEITDSVIMKDRNTGQPRGFGFVTYADSAVVDKVIEDTHVFHGKQVEIKRTIPRGAHSTGFKTKKIFVGGIPTTVDEDEFRDFFSSYGEVKEQQIMRDHSTGRSRGFGFITFDSEQSVDDLLVNGNRLDFAGVQVEIKKAEPKKPNSLPPPSRRQSNSRAGYGGGVGDTYGGFGGGGGGGSGYGGSGFGASSYRSGGTYGGRASAYGGYGGSEFGAYGGYGAGSYGGLRSEASYGYSSRFGGGAGAGFGRGYDLGGEYGGPGDSYAGYGGSGGAGGGVYGGGGAGGSAYGGGGAGGYGGGSGGGYGSGGYDAAFGGGYGGGGGGGGSGSLYGSRGGYGGAGSGRYHPYGR